MIKVDALTKRYPGQPQAALDQIELAIKPGEIFGIVGESGAGKSTLIHCLTGLEQPDSGAIYIADQNIVNLSAKARREASRKIGMIFQHFNLLSSRTVYDNIALPLELANMSTHIITEKVTALLDLTGLSSKKDAYPNELSGGQKQRVAIARALVNDPKLLLSDEATSALDPQTTAKILQLLQKINQQLNITVLLITHEMKVVQQICDRVALIDQGRIVEQGPVYDFFFNPQADVTKKFVTAALDNDIPDVLQQRLNDKNAQSNLVLRLHYNQYSACEPVIAHLTQKFAVTANILQANLDNIHQQTVGMLLLELEGEATSIDKALAYLQQQQVNVEQLGYV